MNIVALSGRIPFDIREFGSEENPVVMFNLSVRRNFKKAEDKYYPEDLINCKAFGHTAKFIKQYINTGDTLEIEGTLQKDDNYEKNGEIVYGQLFVNVQRVMFTPKGNDNNGGGQTQENNKQKNNNPVEENENPFAFLGV